MNKIIGKGTLSDPIIDSSLKKEEALKQNPQFFCPENILRQQTMIDIIYWSFDDKIHKGQLVIDKDLIKFIVTAFSFLLKNKFPIQSVIPIADKKYLWNDEISTSANNTSGFNYRYIAQTERLSNHAFGRAIDINPLLNPYIKKDYIWPPDAKYDISKPGTIGANDPIVSYFKKESWIWGGDWIDRKDYQHFEKPQ